MSSNVGVTDRTARLTLGIGLAVGAFFAHGDWRWIAAPGVVLIATAVTRFCPAYWVTGVGTCARPERTR